jgi:hypothetical protein
MAFSKFANAAVANPVINMAAWDEVRSKAMSGSAFANRGAQSQMLLQKFDPKQYMLSHCTIIASVEVENGPGPLGRQIEGNFQIDRRHSDYFITPGTSKYVNNNQDSWERKLLLGTYRTFIGGQNYVEHLQIPEMSKGRIIDAAARDIGDSIYVDILVATELKHRPLISAIRSKQLSTLSMGCTVAYTMCSKCGNVAEDETQLCPHIRYMKGNSFIDGLGKVRKIAELCGHYTDPQSVKFIEASWVANPAFTGAVLRDILTPEELASVGDRMQVAFSMPAPVADPSLRAKAARDTRLAQVANRTIDLPALYRDDQGRSVVREIHTPHHFHTVLGQGEEEFEGADDATPKPAPAADPLDKAVSDIADILKEKALEKVRGEITKKEESPRADHDETGGSNNLIHQASQSPHWRSIARVVLSKVQDRTRAGRIVTGLVLFKSGGWNAIREQKSFSGREVLAISRFLDEFQGSRIAGETRVYRTVLAVGGVSPYGDVESYLAACRRIYGRELTNSERDALITKGRIFDLGVS